MIEPEVAYADYNEIMSMGEDLIKFVINYVLEKGQDELKFLGQYHDTDQVAFLESLVKEDFNRISYRDAIEKLQAAIKDGVTFDNMNVEFGTDLDTDHERYISEVIGQGVPTYVYDYPSKIKSFYMYQNEDGETCRGFDMLVPRIGELIGGSQREESYDKLMDTIKMKGLDVSELD
jgi:asparaginyl-tRNA synthetase